FEQLLTFGLQGDEPLLKDAATRGNFSSPSFIAALGFYKSLFDEGLAPVASAAQISNVWTEFERGWFSFYFSGPWVIGDFRNRLKVETRWMPTGAAGPEGPWHPTPGGSSRVVSCSSTHQEAAGKLVRFLSEPAVQARFNLVSGDLLA